MVDIKRTYDEISRLFPRGIPTLSADPFADLEQILGTIETTKQKQGSENLSTGMRNLEKSIKSTSEAPVGSGETYAVAELIIQLAALYGAAKVLEAIDKVKNNTKLWLKDYNSDLNKVVDAHLVAEPMMDKREQKVIFKKFDENKGFNFMNRWLVAFGKNASLTSEETILMSKYCSEFSFSGMDIQTDMNSIQFSLNRDISDLKQGNLALSFIVDSRMNIHNSLLKLLNAQFQFKTGRYGYKDDYIFKDVLIIMLDGYNVPRLDLLFGEVFLSGYNGISGDYTPDDLKTVAPTFEYSNFDSSAFRRKTI